MATRALTINSIMSGNTKATKYNYINPNATDEQLFRAAEALNGLSQRTFVSAVVTDTYEIEPPEDFNRTKTSGFRRV